MKMQSINDKQCTVASCRLQLSTTNPLNNFCTAALYFKFMCFPELQFSLVPISVFAGGRGVYINKM